MGTLRRAEDNLYLLKIVSTASKKLLRVVNLPVASHFDLLSALCEVLRFHSAVNTYAGEIKPQRRTEVIAEERRVN